MPKGTDRFVGTDIICAALRGQETVVLDALGIPWRQGNRISPVRTATILTIVRHGGGTRAKGEQSAHAAPTRYWISL
jgi:hypothetical protein